MKPLLDRWSDILVFDYLAHLTRYALIAGIAYLLFYVIFRRRVEGRKIQTSFPKKSDIKREVFYSLSSFAIFAGVGLLTVVMHRLGWTHVYMKISKYGWTYLAFSVVALIFIHDTWFYWTHRLMHTKRLFPIMHKVHHRSHNPTPWAAFAFHPTEAVVEAMIFPIASLILPIHPLAAVIWLLYMTMMNVFGHLGFEIFPQGFVRHWLFRWHNTSVHHNMHHRHVHCNYGLYFNIWDRLMKTNHARYEDEYERVTKRVEKPQTSDSITSR